MKICSFSDMHGQLDFKIEPCDIVLICGDIVPLNIQTNMKKSTAWFTNTFLPWCDELPCEKVLFVGGNHDFFLEILGKNEVDKLIGDNDKIKYLFCNTYEYKGVKIYGTPLCKEFMNWAFMPNAESQRKIFDELVGKNEKIDIIMSHDAPYGVSDIILQKDCQWADGTHIGNKELASLVDKLGGNAPRLFLHGHLHSSSHNKETLNSTDVYNVSLLNENYTFGYNPLYLTY